MKYMGWGWDDYYNCPGDVIDEVLEEMKKEAEEAKRANRKRGRGR